MTQPPSDVGKLPHGIKRRTLDFLGSHRDNHKPTNTPQQNHPKRKHATETLHKLLRVFTASPTPLRVLVEARDQLITTHFGEFLRKAHSYSYLWGIAYPCVVPKRHSELNTHFAPPAGSLSREICWAGAFLALYSSELRIYLSAKREVQRYLLNGDWQLCEAAIADIESRLGLSCWGIKKRILLLGHSEGLEGQKRYLNRLRSECLENGFAYYIAAHASVANEPTVSITHYQEIAEQHLSYIPNNALGIDYLRYHNIPHFQLTQENSAEILTWAGMTSFIDYYEAFIDATSHLLLVESLSNEVKGSIHSAVKSVASTPFDPRLEAILLRSNAHFAVSKLAFCSDFIPILCAWISGRYEDSYKLSTAAILENVDCVEFLEYAARSMVALQKPSELFSHFTFPWLIDLMRKAIAKEVGYESSLMDILKFARNNCNESLSNGLIHFIIQESGNKVIMPDGMELLGKLSYLPMSPKRFSAINAMFSPKVLRAQIAKVDDPMITKILTHLAGLSTESLASLPAQPANTLALYRALNLRDFESALRFAEKSLIEPITYHDGLRAKVQCLYEMDRLHECIDIIAHVGCTKPHLVDLLLIKEVIESFDATCSTAMRGDISLPISYDIYSKHCGSDLDSARNYSFEDFLEEWKVKKPSELASVIGNFDKDRLIYFLRYICIESVMDFSMLFSTSHEVAEERISVCKILVEVDPPNSAVYQNEILELLRKLMIKKRMREIEQSRIYVDIESVKKTARKTLLESFNRYMSFRKQGIGHIADELIRSIDEALLLFVSSGDTQKMTQLILPRSELDEIFIALVEKLRDEYVFSTEHGLDRYLSTRIRHGTLSSFLRRPLEDNHLITPRDRASENYLSNTYWISRIPALTEESRRALDAALANFSREYDELVLDMTAEWLQVKRDPQSKGMFEFSIYRKWLQIMASQVTTEMSFDEFVDMVLDGLGAFLDRCLENVRDRIKSEAKPRMSQIFNSLQSAIEQLNDLADLGDLPNTVRATRTAMQVQLDRISQWFRRARTVTHAPYLLEDAITIALQCVGTRARTLSLETDICSTIQATQIYVGLNSLVDIFITLFENIFRYSEKIAPVTRIVAWHDQGGNQDIHIDVENEVAVGVRNQQVDRKLDQIRITMAEPIMGSVSREGGTGFHKIMKILKHDYEIEQPSLNFGYRDDLNFVVNFQLPGSMLTKRTLSGVQEGAE